MSTANNIKRSMRRRKSINRSTDPIIRADDPCSVLMRDLRIWLKASGHADTWGSKKIEEGHSFVARYKALKVENREVATITFNSLEKILDFLNRQNKQG